MPLFGIDVSTYNGDLNFSALKAAGVRFAMIKASQGHAFTSDAYLFADRRFERNVKGFASVGIPAGAYHFFTASTEAEAIREAECFLDVVRPCRELISLYLACDAENYGNRYIDKLSRGQLTHLIDIFLSRVEQEGFAGCTYTNTDHILCHIDLDALRYPVWQAHYMKNGSVAKPRHAGEKLAIHQYSGSGTLPGITGTFDLNFAYEPLARRIISATTPLEPQTLDYLSRHENGESLLCRLAEKLVERSLKPVRDTSTGRLTSLLRYHCGLSESELSYMLAYTWADELFFKLYAGMLVK